VDSENPYPRGTPTRKPSRLAHPLRVIVSLLIIVAMSGCGLTGASKVSRSIHRLQPVPAKSVAQPTSNLFHPSRAASAGSYAQLWYSPTPLDPIYTGGPKLAFHPVGTSGPGGYAEFATTAQPGPGAAPVAIVWIDQAHARLQIYAGTSQPGGQWPYQGYIPTTLYPQLIGAFEGGFQFAVSNGGFYQAGRIGSPLIPGAASLVEYNNGLVSIGSWGTEVSMNQSVESVRQNLQLLVDNGKLNPLVYYRPLVTWGYSLGNLLSTWRSGLGITANGNLVWVGGPGLSPAELGQILIDAHSVRAMQLDINPDWVNFAYYSYLGNQINGTNVLPQMVFPPSHYLVPFWRDFIAVFLRKS
jgi:hypothetical protein